MHLGVKAVNSLPPVGKVCRISSQPHQFSPKAVDKHKIGPVTLTVEPAHIQLSLGIPRVSAS